jgi:nucleoside triphosphate pyrophosphatase
LGLDPEIRPTEVDESYLAGETPVEHVERLARAKAAVVPVEDGHTIVVGGDTVVVDGGVVLSKPGGPEEAVEMLMRLSGGEHEVLSGLALVDSSGVVSTVSRTLVRMRGYGAATAKAYTDTGEPLDKAGAYGIQGQGAALVESIRGDYYSVVGFPIGAFIELLDRAGWHFGFDGLTPHPDGGAEHRD